MKKIFLQLILVLVILNANATIRRVNNNPGVTLVAALVFADFTAAQTAAVAGDTIYIEPSDINYGSITVSKKLVIVGPGYLLNKNPNTPFDKRTAKVAGLAFGIGSSGSKVYGLDIKNPNGNYADIFFTTATSDIEIFGCIFNDLRSNGSNTNFFNGLLTNCFIVGSVRKASFTMSHSTIANNIILGFFESSDSDVIVKNNIIFGGIDYTSIYYNNIIYSTNVGNLFDLSPNVYNNVCVGCTGTPTNNNFFTTAQNTIFAVTEPRTLDDLEDDNFILAVSSPAKTKGIGGIDCGVFAGPKPYILSGIPPFPMITAFTQGAISAGNIPITISIKRN
ncbi:hypothetical protein EMA8858_01976 [Emticicia aquatica]|uniref:Periplasmic copper-binding protein NosD beta helix domain-containing protein n=1 Tax=Emticicia aquatica TaxID=1681835 RepID=A0ABM9APM1_9BACT|nr:hypothetical protein [Emticicia aquatica]CAH0995848.1 hypothetical protein EMA8858_01976 [Emticicia aquatica]